MPELTELAPNIRSLAIALAFVMFAGGAGFVYLKFKTNAPGSFQAFSLVLLIPTILALAVTDSLSKDVLAALLGGVAGYIFGQRGDGTSEI